MIKDLDSFYTSKDAVSVKYSDLEGIFIANDIRMHHLAKNKHLYVKIFKDIEIEGDTNFWGNTDTLPRIGAFSYTSSNFYYGVKIGRYCSLSENIRVMGAHHFTDWVSTSPSFYREGYHDLSQEVTLDRMRRKAKINIGNDVWIGADVVLKADLKIGHGAIIASNSVVTKDVPPYMIVGGVPAKIIKPRFNEDLIEDMLKSEWWKYHKNDFYGFNARKPTEFIDKLNEKVFLGEIKEYSPTILTLSDIIK